MPLRKQPAGRAIEPLVCALCGAQMGAAQDRSEPHLIMNAELPVKELKSRRRFRTAAVRVRKSIAY